MEVFSQVALLEAEWVKGRPSSALLPPLFYVVAHFTFAILLFSSLPHRRGPQHIR